MRVASAFLSMAAFLVVPTRSHIQRQTNLLYRLVANAYDNYAALISEIVGLRADITEQRNSLRAYITYTDIESATDDVAQAREAAGFGS
jgi:hypothetical protein